MIHVYGIPNCNTVKKSIDWLKANNIAFTFHDFKKEGVTAAKLRTWCKYFGWQNLVNKAGTTWKGLDDDQKAAVTNQRAAIKLMMENTSVIRRPVVEAGDLLLIRFKEEEYADALLSK